MKNPNIENSNKIFIGGLSWNTTQNKLKDYFEQFGPVKDWVLMIEKTTGRSRGFGFVIMRNIYDTYKIFNNPVHILDGKQIDCKKAVPKDKVQTQSKQLHNIHNKASEKIEDKKITQHWNNKMSSQIFSQNDHWFTNDTTLVAQQLIVPHSRTKGSDSLNIRK